MRGFFNDGLCDQDFTADGAARAFRQTGCRAGRRNSRNGLRRMGKLFYDLLLRKDDSAYRAMAAFRQTGTSTGGCNGVVNNDRMCRRNDLLRDQNLAADAAMRAFGQSVLRAGGRNCGIGYRRMCRRDNLLRKEHLLADGTMGAFRQAGFRAGRSDCRVGDRSMTGCRYGVTGIGIAAFCASVGGITVLLTGRRSNGCGIGMRMGICRQLPTGMLVGGNAACRKQRAFCCAGLRVQIKPVFRCHKAVAAVGVGEYIPMCSRSRVCRQTDRAVCVDAQVFLRRFIL